MRSGCGRPPFDDAVRLDGDIVRTIKVGIACDRIWNILADAIAEVPSRPSKAEYLEVLDRAGRVPVGVMFAEAMKRHLSPRER